MKDDDAIRREVDELSSSSASCFFIRKESAMPSVLWDKLWLGTKQTLGTSGQMVYKDVLCTNSGCTPMTSGNIDHPYNFAYHDVKEKIYWSDPDEYAIERINLLGSSREEMFDGEGPNIKPQAMTLSVESGLVFFVNGDKPGYIYSIGVDIPSGSSAAERHKSDMIEIDNSTGVIHSAMTVASGVRALKLYVMTQQYSVEKGKWGFRVSKRDFDGTNREWVTSNRWCVTDDPCDMLIYDGKIYWTAPGADEVGRADIDGSNVEILSSISNSAPYGLAIATIDGWDDVQDVNPDVFIGYAGELIGNRLIFTQDGGDDLVRSCNLDGSENIILASGLDDVHAVIIIRTPDSEYGIE